MRQTLNVGIWSRVLIPIGVMLTASTIWLGLVSDVDRIITATLFIFIPGILLLIMAIRGSPPGSAAREARMWMVVAVVLFLNFMVGILLVVVGLEMALFPLFSSLIGAMLFAIYEESHMMGVAALMKSGGVTDWLVILVSAGWFMMMHALAYSPTIQMSITLFVGRILFTAGALAADNTDVAFLAHLLWNIAAVIGA